MGRVWYGNGQQSKGRVGVVEWTGVGWGIHCVEDELTGSDEGHVGLNPGREPQGSNGEGY